MNNAERALLTLAQTQHGVLSRQQALCEGLSASAIFLDFAYPDVKLAIEADSYVWHASLADWRRDRARNNELVALGWSILPIAWDLVMRSPTKAARQVRSARETRLAGI
jgi:very-short-patch-repair endonuclease